MFCKSKKMISMLIVFVIMFTYSAQTLQAIATTDGITTITDGFFGSSDMVLKAYFEKEENQNNEKILNVNEKGNLILEVSPKEVGSGFIREGMIKANAMDENNLHFKFSKIVSIEVEDGKEKPEENEEEAEDNSFVSLNMGDTSEENVEPIIEDKEDELVDEEKVIEDKMNEEENEDDLNPYQVELVSDYEIQVRNIIHPTKIEVEIEYLPKEEITLSDLYQEVEFVLSGKYIDVDLNEKEESISSNVAIGWSYHNEIEMTSEYTKFSPYHVGERQGSLLENKITIKRENQNEEENYLPLKNTNLEILVPTLNGQRPANVNVVANKLMASKGQDTGNVQFTEENWEYQEQEGKIYIHVSNDKEGKVVNSLGTDEYIIIYKYANFVDEGNYTFENNVIVNAEEVGANENNNLTTSISETQEITAVIGDMISYHVSTNEEVINKGKINANYNHEEALYEAEFTTAVNLNILTSDAFEELTIDTSKENYLDAKQTAFETNDVFYKKVKFSYSEIENILTNGGVIEIYNNAGELLNSLNADNVHSQEECEINLENKPNGIQVVLKSVSVNQNLNIEYIKAIGKSSYDKAEYNMFREIESKVTASVKYEDDENRYQLSEMTVKKAMKSSFTNADIVLSNNNFSTISENENVEMRIELNNDTVDSDLYTNPSFEIVFPSYVKSVTPQSINLTYAEGLSVADATVHNENGIVKMKINLAGTQNAFSESTLTHGTNILVQFNVTLDEYTPSKKDQIKMYYCNEAVTNYQSQTKWTLDREIPQGIVRETNGFEVEVINYQAPSGLTTANAIINYDGEQSVVKSVKQGQKNVNIARGSSPRIATMELYAANNTGNECKDIVLLGRTPFAHNTDVITGEDLGSNVNSNMFSKIVANEQNKNTARIYYSGVEKATADLEDANNGWTEEPTTLLEVKSYMIVVEDVLLAGEILKYSYEFEIPANLDYGAAIYGSFGGYYSNLSSNETTIADKVGLLTEEMPEIKLSLETKEENIFYGQMATLVAKVENKTGDALENVVLNVSVPEGAVYVEYQEGEGYIEDSQATVKEFGIEKLAAGETGVYEFPVKILEHDAESKTLQGYLQINNVTENYTIEAEKQKLSMEATLVNTFSGTNENTKVSFLVSIAKSEEDEKEDFNISFDLPEYLEIKKIYTLGVGEIQDLEFDRNNEKVVAQIGELKEDVTKVFVDCEMTDSSFEGSDVHTTIELQTNDKEKKICGSTGFEFTAERKEAVEVWQEISSQELNYEDIFEYKIIVKSQKPWEEVVTVKAEIPSILCLKDIKVIIGGVEEGLNSYNYFEREFVLPANGTIEIVAIGEVIHMADHGEDTELSNIVEVELGNGATVESDALDVKINKLYEKSKSDSQEENQNESEVEQEENTEDENEANAIAGVVYVDTDNDGVKTSKDKQIASNVQVQLMKGSNMIKATTTDSKGNYAFHDLEPGDYSVTFNYDKERYTTTSKNKISEIEDGLAVTDNITIAENGAKVNIGLTEKDRFDLSLSQTIAKTTVLTNNKLKEQEYEDLDLAKLNLTSKELEDAIVKMEYKIKVENVGNVAGKVANIVNYVPNGMKFVAEDNPDWNIGADGNLYYTGLKDMTLKAGEAKEVRLSLAKQLTQVDNIGIISNKAQIVETESSTRIVEAKANNFATQETIIAKPSSMGKVAVVIEVALIASVAIFGYMIKTGRIDEKELIKKVYR